MTSSYWTRSDNNEPVQPQLDPGVLNVMQEMVKIMGEQAAVLDSLKPSIQSIANPTINPPIQIKTQPDLQDILTNETPDLSNIKAIKDEIADVISTADTTNTQPFQSDTDVPNLPPDWIENPDIISEINNRSSALNIPPLLNIIKFPIPTGDPEVDEKNLDDYYDTLQKIRGDTLIITDDDASEEDEDNDGKKYTPYVDTDGNILVKGKTKKNYVPPINRRNKIYRDNAKKKAILTKIKATRLKNKKEQYKTNVLVPTDATNNEIGNPQATTIVPPLIKEDIVTDDDVDFKVDIIDSDDDVTYVKYIPPPPEIPVPPPIHPRDRLKQQLTAPKSPEIDTFPDDETIDYVPTKEEIDELSDADLSDTETISYLPNYNRRNQIYREKAKKRALKILSRTREKRKNRYKKNTIESKVHVLVPTEVEIKTNNPIDILANPNVTTILPGQLETEDDIIDYKLPVDIPSSDSNVTNHVPLQLDTDKIIMKDDGDIVLTEPDNMQVSEGALVPISNNTLQLENNTDMSEIATRNIVLKRKQPDVSVANIKKTKGDTEISIQHPIFRKIQKQSNLDKKNAKILSQGKPIDIEVANDNLLAIEDKPTLPMLLPSPSSSENIPTTLKQCE